MKHLPNFNCTWTKQHFLSKPHCPVHQYTSIFWDLPLDFLRFFRLYWNSKMLISFDFWTKGWLCFISPVYSLRVFRDRKTCGGILFACYHQQYFILVRSVSWTQLFLRNHFAQIFGYRNFTEKLKSLYVTKPKVRYSMFKAFASIICLAMITISTGV